MIKIGKVREMIIKNNENGISRLLEVSIFKGRSNKNSFYFNLKGRR